MVRLSGPRALKIVRIPCPWLPEDPPSHSIRYGTFREPDGTVLDEVVVGLFREPRSYTREEVVEISFHGSPYVLSRALELILSAGARLAEPGEFTLRAFRNGALDLSQAEAVADLIAARTRQAQQAALRQLRGGMSHELRTMRQQLVDFAALVELELDFAEEDVEFARREELLAVLEAACLALLRMVESFRAGNALKHGFATAIVGPPNAGKSTLLNRLIGEQKAIVSPIPGTTRDVVEDLLVLGGFPFRLMDTAGLRDTTDPIEAEGVRRSHERLQQAQLVLLVVDAATTAPNAAQDYLQGLPADPEARKIALANKADQLSGEARAKWQAAGFLPISAETGDGMDPLIQELVAFAHDRTQYDTLVTSQRHAQALQEAYNSLQTVALNLRQGISGELLALDIRVALEALGTITGEITTDDILGSIFSRFCIGK